MFCVLCGFCSGGRQNTCARLKPHLHRNANRTQTWHEKIMRTFDVDVFLRRGKQHSAVRWTFSEQPNAIAKCRYFKRNSHTIRLDLDVIFFLHLAMTGFQATTGFHRSLAALPPTPAYTLPALATINSAVRTVHNFFQMNYVLTSKKCCQFICINERTAWEQSLLAASASAEKCTNLPT